MGPRLGTGHRQEPVGPSREAGRDRAQPGSLLGRAVPEAARSLAEGVSRVGPNRFDLLVFGGAGGCPARGHSSEGSLFSR